MDFFKKLFRKYIMDSMPVDASLVQLDEPVSEVKCEEEVHHEEEEVKCEEELHHEEEEVKSEEEVHHEEEVKLDE